MRTLLFFVSILIAAYVAAQDIPGNITDAFEQKFKGAQNVEWNRIDDNFEATFFLDDEIKTVVFDKSARLVMTKIELMSEADLPVKVVKVYMTAYPDAYAYRFLKIETPDNKVSYEVEITKNDEVYILHISADGKITDTEKVEISDAGEDMEDE
ncbi:MAG: PepSY-like domain-containing protein [Bacteroidetes bacterium]|nr:PepSY-like domain-containing protein [Bacteroidota bacterium]